MYLTSHIWNNITGLKAWLHDCTRVKEVALPTTLCHANTRSTRQCSHARPCMISRFLRLGAHACSHVQQRRDDLLDFYLMRPRVGSFLAPGWTPARHAWPHGCCVGDLACSSSRTCRPSLPSLLAAGASARLSPNYVHWVIRVRSFRILWSAGEARRIRRTMHRGIPTWIRISWTLAQTAKADAAE
jgi:hypothetical protein